MSPIIFDTHSDEYNLHRNLILLSCLLNAISLTAENKFASAIFSGPKFYSTLRRILQQTIYNIKLTRS